MKCQGGNIPIALRFYFFLAIPIEAQELVRSTFCWNQDFRLDCSNRSSMLTIHQAVFTNDPAVMNASKCSRATEDNGLLCFEDIGISLNSRCSGMSHCHFNLTQDHPLAKCACTGVIQLVYACVDREQIGSYCNMKLAEPRGYITSPGYPQFYPKISDCRWTIEISEGQEVQMTVLDLALKPKRKHRRLDICLFDSLTVLEDGHKLRQICGAANNETRRPFVSSGGKISVKFSSDDFTPSRGFLLYYKAHGCPTLPPPPLGYLVHRNKTSALYMCCKDHVFNDTLQTSRVFHCVDDFKWNESMASCLTFDEINRDLETSERNTTEILDVVEISLKRSKYFEDILIPSASVVGLLFGNVAVILVIMKIRKKRKFGGTSQTQIPQPVDATPISASVPVTNSIPRAPQVLMSDL